MGIKIHNSLGNNIEDFKPLLEGHVSMYHCGPTVYDFVHIGNLRSFYLGDLLRRTFEYSGFYVKQVVNITDIGQLSDGDGEDKMTKGLIREGKPITLEAMQELARFYTERFKEDSLSINILPAHHYPKASEHLDEQIRIIEELEQKGFAYTISDGVYFDTSKDPHYGKLGGTGGSESRIGENSEKRNFKDFALWKLNENLGFPSPWGQGFPGWHIECSAMSAKYLGQPFDIHTGGIDLAPIHHNNEIAQSENACNTPLAHYWLHNEFVTISDSKMAKSAGSGVTLRTLTEKGYSPLSYRYFLLGSHYRTQTNFSYEALDASENAYKRLKTLMRLLESKAEGEGTVHPKYKQEFLEALQNDLNTPEALAIVWKLAKYAGDDISYSDALATLHDFDRVLGLRLGEKEAIIEIPEEVESLIKERDLARLARNFSKADVLRETIKKLGYEVKDTDSGQEISKL